MQVYICSLLVQQKQRIKEVRKDVIARRAVGCEESRCSL